MLGASSSTADTLYRANRDCSRYSCACSCAAELKLTAGGRMVPKELLRLKRKWYRALRRTSPRSPARSPSDRAAVRPRRLGKYHPRRSSGRVALLSVRALRLDLIGEGVVEVQLRGELVTLLGL